MGMSLGLEFSLSAHYRDYPDRTWLVCIEIPRSDTEAGWNNQHHYRYCCDNYRNRWSAASRRRCHSRAAHQGLLPHCSARPPATRATSGQAGVASSCRSSASPDDERHDDLTGLRAPATRATSGAGGDRFIIFINTLIVDAAIVISLHLRSPHLRSPHLCSLLLHRRRLCAKHRAERRKPG